MLRAIKGMGTGQLSAVIREGRGPEGIKGDALEETGRNDPVGVDVIAPHHNAGARDAAD